MPFVLWKFQSHSFLFYLHEPTTIHRYCYCYHPAIKRLNATIEKFHSHFENDGPRNINNKLWSIIDEAPQPVIKLDGVCTAAIQLLFIILSFYERAYGVWNYTHASYSECILCMVASIEISNQQIGFSFAQSEYRCHFTCGRMKWFFMSVGFDLTFSIRSVIRLWIQ